MFKGKPGGREISLRYKLFLLFAGTHEFPQRIGSRRVNPIVA